MSKTLIGMGSAAMDSIICCSSLPGDDSFQVVDSEQLLPGGSCANMLAAFAALGGSSRLVSKIGDDSFGRQLLDSLKRDKVDDSFLVHKAGGQTLHTYIWVAGGSHCIFICLGDSLMSLASDELAPHLLEGADIFYTDLFPPQPALDTARKCRRQGIPVIIGMQCSPSFMRRAGVSDEDLHTALSLADLVIGGQECYQEYLGCNDSIQALEALYDKYRPTFGAVCTLGSAGSVWLDQQGFYQAGAYQVEPLDSTGAGDCFLGGLLYSYFAAGSDQRTALHFASAMGALKCGQLGARISTSPRQVADFIQNNHLDYNFRPRTKVK